MMEPVIEEELWEQFTEDYAVSLYNLHPNSYKAS